MAQNDWTFNQSGNSSVLEGVSVFHDSLSDPLTVGGTYCRQWTMQSGRTTRGFFVSSKNPNAQNIPDTKAVSVRAWMRMNASNQGSHGHISVRTRSDQNWNSTNSGYFIYRSDNTFHMGGKQFSAPQGFSAGWNQWVHLRLDSIPIKHNGAVIMDRQRGFVEINGSWVLVADEYIESTDTYFEPWDGRDTYNGVNFNCYLYDNEWFYTLVDKIEILTETVEQPSVLGLSLTNDTGPSNTDKITSDSSITTTGAENGATVEYSLDGVTWQQALPTFDSGSYSLYAKQTRADGKVSPVTSLDFTVIPDDTHLSITSATTASVVENVGQNQVVYTAQAENEFSAIIYSLNEAGDYQKFSLNASSGQVTLLEDPDFETSSSYDFTFTATDLAGFSKERAVTLSVVDANEAPSFTVTFLSGTQGTPLNESAAIDTEVATLSASDPDNDAVTFSIVSQTVDGTFALSASSLVLTGALDYESNSSHVVTLRASDGNLDTDQAYTIYLADVNEAPTFSLTLSTGSVGTPLPEDSSTGLVLGTLSGSDVDGDSLTFSIVSQTPADIFEISGSDLKLSGALDYETDATHSITLRATDGTNNVDQNYTIYIGDVAEAAATDSNFSDVALLLAMDGTNGSTTFTDDSSNNFTVTANGNTAISTTESKFGGASAYFDGSGDYLQLSYDNSLDIGNGNGDWTLECWVRMPSIPSDSMDIMGSSLGGGNQAKWLIAMNMGTDFLYSANRVGFVTYNGGANQWINASYTWQADTWYHIAVVHDSGTTTMYVDGTSVGSISYNIPAVNAGIRVGTDGEGYKYFAGYMDDVRITKGTARYTSNFTPPTAAHPTTGPSDSNFSDVSLLLKMDGSNGSTTFTDDSSNSLTVTVNGNTALSTTESKFGGASAYFDGNGDYLEVDYSESWNLSNGDFTIECWIRPEGLSNLYQGVFAQGDHQFIAMQFNEATADGKLHTWMDTTGTSGWELYQVSNTTFSNSQWYHVALVRESNTVKLYVDGQQDWSASFTGTVYTNSSTPLYIGRSQLSTRFFEGYIDDLRITKGVARYTSNFTPPGSHPTS